MGIEILFGSGNFDPEKMLLQDYEKRFQLKAGQLNRSVIKAILGDKEFKNSRQLYKQAFFGPSNSFLNKVRIIDSYTKATEGVRNRVSLNTNTEVTDDHLLAAIDIFNFAEKYRDQI